MRTLIFLLLFSCAIFAHETKAIKGTSHETKIEIPVLEKSEKIVDVYGIFNLTGSERVISFPYTHYFQRPDGLYILICKLEMIGDQLLITAKISHNGTDAPAGIDYHITIEYTKSED